MKKAVPAPVIREEKKPEVPASPVKSKSPAVAAPASKAVVSKKATELYNMGNTSIRRGDFEGSLRYFEQAMEADQNYPLSYIGRGIIYAKQGNNDAALADFDRAIGLSAEYAAAFYNRGLVHAVKGNTDTAIVDFSRAVELNPRYAVAYLDLANAYAARREKDLAIKNYKKAKELNMTLANQCEEGLKKCQ